jgi:DNA primase
VLKHSGRNYFGLCPFHIEKTPSFSVSPEKQLYHCFGCGEGGGVVSFVMKLERLEFLDAIKLLAERAGMPLPDAPAASQRGQDAELRQQLYEMNRECARYYYNMLFSPQGRDALNYLKERGLDLSTIKSFGLGYAPDLWDGALELLRGKGFNEKQMLKAGIIVESKDKGKVFDRFRNRIMFPIIHPRGMVLGFGGRIMDDSQPKYLNSPESPVFDKSSILFGLNLAARLRPLQYIILVEGYMDVIAMHQYGFGQAVASLGTSLTQGQAKLIRRYAQEIYIAYDGDNAGQAATIRGLDILHDAGCKVRVIQLANGKDPDDILKKYGPEYFRKMMDQSQSLIDYKLDRLKEQYDISTQEGRISFGTEAAELLARVDNLIERDTHIQKLETLIGIKPSVIYEQIRKIQGNTADGGVKRNINGNNRYTRRYGAAKVLLPSHIKAERHLINLMVQSQTNAIRITEGLENESFEDPFHQEVLDIVREMLKDNREINSAQLLKNISDAENTRKLVDIFNHEMEYDNIDTFISDCLDQVKRYRLIKQREEIQNEISGMERNGISDPGRYKILLQQLEDLNRKASLDRPERREWHEKRRN